MPYESDADPEDPLALNEPEEEAEGLEKVESELMGAPTGLP